MFRVIAFSIYPFIHVSETDDVVKQPFFSSRLVLSPPATAAPRHAAAFFFFLFMSTVYMCGFRTFAGLRVARKCVSMLDCEPRARARVWQ